MLDKIYFDLSKPPIKGAEKLKYSLLIIYKKTLKFGIICVIIVYNEIWQREICSAFSFAAILLHSDFYYYKEGYYG